MRKIKIYSTRDGVKQVEVPQGEITWGALKEILNENNISYSGFKVMENKNNSELVNDNSIIPAEAQMIALTPVKTKSGLNPETMSYKELRSKISELVNSSEVAKEHFNQNKNYTNKSTSLLRQLLTDWLADDTPQEVVEENLTTMTKSDIVNAISNLPDYEENQECFDKAIDLLMGEDCEVEKESAPVTLSSDEESWLEDMGIS